MAYFPLVSFALPPAWPSTWSLGLPLNFEGSLGQ